LCVLHITMIRRLRRFLVWFFLSFLSLFGGGSAYIGDKQREPKHRARREKRIVEANTRRQRDYAVNSKTSKQYSMAPNPRKRRR
uniref:Secreted protein n=1 Tax=Anisakis simplex TaxID=6269 RepID=A0A0M3JA92_ANISI